MKSQRQNENAERKIELSHRISFFRRNQRLPIFHNLIRANVVITQARGGLGLSIQSKERKIQLIEKRFWLLTKNLATLQEWSRLVAPFSVSGVTKHNAPQRLIENSIICRETTMF